jgi:hypothetical protein
MNNQNLELLNRVINTLMLIDTHGENSFAMVQCIQTLQKIVETESAALTAATVAPVLKEE